MMIFKQLFLFNYVFFNTYKLDGNFISQSICIAVIPKLFFLHRSEYR